MAIFLTDFRESVSYIKVVPKILILKALIFSSLGFCFLSADFIKLKKEIAGLLICIPLFYSIFKYVIDYQSLKANSIYGFRINYVSPFRVLTRCFLMYDSVRKELDTQNQLKSEEESWSITSVGKTENITVIVIGESVRKDFLGIYNSAFNNTPFLNSIPKLQFQNTISYAHQTLESLSASFMLREKKRPYFPNNIISLSKKVGFEVSWISNQGSIGVEDNYIAAMGKISNYHQFVSKGRWNEHVDDHNMIDVFRTRVSIRSNKPQVIFLHMIGSHPDPCDITNGEYEKFIFSKNLSCYYESIKRTDYFLSEVYEILKKEGRGFNLVYFSDHGLYNNNNERIYHRNDFKENYDVPLIVINPKIKHNTYIKKYRNLKDFMLFYSELLNFKTKNLNSEYRFISNETDNNVFELYNGLNYKTLKDNKILTL